VSRVNLIWKPNKTSPKLPSVVYGTYFSVENEGLRGCLLFKVCNNNHHLFKFPVLCFSVDGKIRVIDFDLSIPSYGFRKFEVGIKIKRLITTFDSRSIHIIHLLNCCNTTRDCVYIYQKEGSPEPSFVVPVFDKDGHRKTSPNSDVEGSLFYYYVDLNSGNIIKLESTDTFIPVEVHIEIVEKED